MYGPQESGDGTRLGRKGIVRVNLALRRRYARGQRPRQVRRGGDHAARLSGGEAFAASVPGVDGTEQSFGDMQVDKALRDPELDRLTLEHGDAG